MKSINSLVLAQDLPPPPGGVSVYVDNFYKNWKERVIILAPSSSELCNINFSPNITIKRLSMDLRRGGIKPYLKRQIVLYRASLDQIKTEKTDSDLAEHSLLIMRKEVFKEIGSENELLPRGLDPYLTTKISRKGL